MKLEKEELIKVVGGDGISATMLNAIVHVIDSIMDVGRSLGTAIRRIYSNNIC